MKHYLTENELSFTRFACIWLDFGEDDNCFVFPFGLIEIDKVVEGKVVKAKELAFCRVYEDGDKRYIETDYPFPLTKIRGWVNKDSGIIRKYVTNSAGILI